MAKIASDLQKPDGLVVVHPGEEAAFLSPLAVGKLPSVGPKTAERLRQEGVETIGQLAGMPLDWHQRRFGKRGEWVMHRSRGIDHDRVNTDRETKSVSAETTFSNDISDPVELREVLAKLTQRVAKQLERKGLLGRTVSVKLRLADFTTFTRQATPPRADPRGVRDPRTRLEAPLQRTDPRQVLPPSRRGRVGFRVDPAASPASGNDRGRKRLSSRSPTTPLRSAIA